MKQIWPNYSYSPTTNVLTLTGLNIDRDQLLLVTAADRGRIMYNFADSSVTASAFTSGANTALTLVATTAGLTTTAALVIYYDDQVASNSVTGTVELGPTSLNALESITVTMGQVTVTGGLTDVQLRASAVTIGGTVTVGNSVTISSLPAISGTVTVGVLPSLTNNTNFVTVGQQIAQGINAYGTIAIAADWENANQGIGNLNVTATCVTSTNRIGVVTIGGGTVTIGAGTAQIGSVTASISNFPATQAVSLTTLPALVAGTAQIGSVTASISGTVPVSGTFFQATQPASLASLPALAAGTNQIGSVTASISGTVPISISSVTVGNSVTIGSLPALAAGTAQIGSVTASISNSVTIASLPAISGTVTANTFALQGTAVTTSNFTSTTASTVLASLNATREVLTIFNEGAGNLHICAGATCTTIAYQVRLSAGDYYEVPNHQTTITHSAVFATAGTARVCQVS
jgi:hypothetical protein